MPLLDKPAAGRAFYQRFTPWGAILIAAALAGVGAGENLGQLPAGTEVSLQGLLAAIGGLLGTLGIYRHVAN